MTFQRKIAGIQIHVIIVNVLGHCIRMLKEQKKCYIVITIIISFLREERGTSFVLLSCRMM